MNTLVILHGWQSSSEKWQAVKDAVEDEHLQVIVPDIPGFKPQTALTKPWNLNDYILWFEKFYEENNLEKAQGIFLLGHSFGGRMAIKYAVKHPENLRGIILVSAAGIRHNSTKKKVLGKAAKIVKKLNIKEDKFSRGFLHFFRKAFYKFIVRKSDYLGAEGPMKQTIENILQEDLRGLIGQIKTPTKIIWGVKDHITPLEDAYFMECVIDKVSLEVIEHVGHTPHIEVPQILAKKIKEFIWHNK